MSEAIAYHGGQSTVTKVVAFIEKYYAHRQWKRKSIEVYFYFMSKPQRFSRVTRGTYRNTAQANRAIAASLQEAYDGRASNVIPITRKRTAA